MVEEGRRREEGRWFAMVEILTSLSRRSRRRDTFWFTPPSWWVHRFFFALQSAQATRARRPAPSPSTVCVARFRLSAVSTK